MKTIFRNTFLTTIAIILSVLPGCKKDFLDINENPNSPADVDIKFILPSAQADLAYTVGNQFQIVAGLWSQYWTQGPNASQYAEYDRYFYNNTEADRPWQALYSGTLKDLDVLYEKARAENKRDYMAIARILQAYTLQVITDAWGDAPYSEALLGDEGNVAPKYDSQESIYDALIAIVDEGIGISDTLLYLDPDYDPANGPQTDDLVYQGTDDGLFHWNKFAYTLKLKIYLRQVNIRPSVASAGIAALPADPTYYLESGEDAFVNYITEKFRQNPLYTTERALNTTKNLFASATSVDYLESLGDPRLRDFYNRNSLAGYAGIKQGAGKNTELFPPPTTDGVYSQYNSTQIIAATAPVRLITASESMFLQAEAIARGLMTGDAQAMYEAAIEDSWGQWVNASASLGDLPAYLALPEVAYPTGGSVEDQVKAIITQKWISMNGNQNFESWTEWRRTGYPDFLIESRTSTLSDTLDPKVFPGRLLYPSDELTTNPNVITGLSITDKVWWDVN